MSAAYTIGPPWGLHDLRAASAFRGAQVNPQEAA